MILTVNIHPTGFRIIRAGQGGRTVAIDMPDATGNTMASIFPGTTEGWDALYDAVLEGRAKHLELDQQATQLYVVWELPYTEFEDGDSRRRGPDRPVVVTDPKPKAEAEEWAGQNASSFAGRLEVRPARQADLDDADGAE